jgi:hypothetical protein
MASGKARPPCGREATRRPPGVTDEEHEEYERTVHAMLDALEEHAIKTGCDVTRFVLPKDRADCICAACGTVVYDGPEFESDA